MSFKQRLDKFNQTKNSDSNEDILIHTFETQSDRNSSEVRKMFSILESSDSALLKKRRHNNYPQDEIEDCKIQASDEIDNVFKKMKNNYISSKKTSSISMNPAKDDDVDHSLSLEMQLTPWITKNTMKIKNSLVRFHNEIIDFCQFVSPSEQEHLRRENAYIR